MSGIPSAFCVAWLLGCHRRQMHLGMGLEAGKSYGPGKQLVKSLHM